MAPSPRGRHHGQTIPETPPRAGSSSTSTEVKEIRRFWQQLSSRRGTLEVDDFRMLACTFSRYPDIKSQAVALGMVSVLVRMLGFGSHPGIQANAARTLAALCVGREGCHAGSQAAVAAAGGLQLLVRLLSSGCEVVRTAALDAAWAACFHNEHCAAELAAAGAMPLLLPLLRTALPKAQEMAIRTLFIISTSTASRARLADDGILPALLRLRGSSCQSTAHVARETLRDFWLEASRDPQLAAATATAAARLLRRNSAAAQHEAALGIQLIATACAKHQEIICWAGAVPPLVRLLGSASSDVAAASAAALRAVSTDNQGAQHEVAAAGALPALMRLLGSKSEPLRTAAAEALLSVCQDALVVTRSTMPTAPLPLLIKLLAAGPEGPVKLAAVHCLFLFSGVSEEHKARVVAAGAVPALERLMDHCSENLELLVLEAVRGITGFKEPAAAAASTARLVRLLGSSDRSIQMGSAIALVSFCSDAGSHVAKPQAAATAAAGAIPRLVQLLESDTEVVVVPAAAALSFICVGSGEPGSRQLGAIILRLLKLLEGATLSMLDGVGMAIGRILACATDRAMAAAACVLPSVVRLLGSPTAAVRAEAAQLLHKVCASSQDRAGQVERAGAIPPLVRMLADPGNTPCQRLAADALSSLTYSDSNHAAAGPAVAPLVQLLGSCSDKVKECAATALVSLCLGCSRHAVAAAAAGAVPLLTALLLESPSPTLRTRAAFIWWKTAQHSRASVKSACRRAIPAFSQLLGSMSVDDQHCAAGALHHICADAENHALVVEAGALPHLVRLLSFSPTLVLEEVAGTVKQLASGAGARALLATTRAVPELVSCLGPWIPPAVQAQVVGALMNLSIHPGGAAAAVAAGGIHPLLDCVARSPSAEAQAHAAGALWNLAVDADSRAQVGAAGAVLLLAQRLAPLKSDASAATAIALEMAVSALSSLCYQTTAHQDQLAQSGCIPDLVPLLSSCSAALQQAAATALVNITANTHCQDELVAAGAVPLLVRLLGSPATSLQQKAAGALWNICSGDAEYHTLVAAAGAVPPLVQLLGSASAVVRLHAAGALRNIAFNEDNQAVVAAAGAIPALIPLLGCQSSAGVQEQAAAALANVCCDSLGNEKQAVEAGAIPPLLQLLKSPVGGVREQAAAALRNVCHSKPDQRVTSALVDFRP